jgi:hypothetical protein
MDKMDYISDSDTSDSDYSPDKDDSLMQQPDDYSDDDSSEDSSDMAPVQIDLNAYVSQPRRSSRLKSKEEETDSEEKEEVDDGGSDDDDEDSDEEEDVMSNEEDVSVTLGSVDSSDDDEDEEDEEEFYKKYPEQKGFVVEDDEVEYDDSADEEDDEDDILLSPKDYDDAKREIESSDVDMNIKCGACVHTLGEVDDDVVAVKPCEHLFHERCGYKWFTRQSGNCPVCGASVLEAL